MLRRNIARPVIPTYLHLETREPPAEVVDRREFSPSYTSHDGRVVLLNDSVKAEPSLAVTLLRGLALSRDVDQMLDKLLLKPTTRQLAAERECYKSDRDIARQKGKTWEQQAKTSGAEVERLKKELADARAMAGAAQAEVEKMRMEKEKLKATDLKGYEDKIIRASQEYTRVAHKMVNDELEVRLPDFYRLDYAFGAKEMTGVMAIESGVYFLNQLPEPVILDLELPYTEEECQP
ncbi:hypothetical protein RHGRI_007450 [Rhododendron griersonianum]|uniref:Uncharacterized protein n=1 Tax=Rhododendron griersonianum TaxID=479676 RepID=A0AAV6KX05_9ERIC|nr:hypothetical protein RHGRI_007450 [Rhododendron griersonianum]